MSGIIDTVGSKSGIVGSDVYPAGHVIGFEGFTETSGSNIAGVTGTHQLTAETSITIVVKNASSKMLIHFQSTTAEGDSNRVHYHIRRTIGGSTSTLRGFATSDKGHAMVDVNGQFATIVLNDIDTHGQAVGTSIVYYVQMQCDSYGYWRAAGSNASGYVMEVMP